MKRNHTFNSKSIQWLLFACLTFSFSFFMLLMSSCSDDEHEEVNNQALSGRTSQSADRCQETGDGPVYPGLERRKILLS